MASAPRLGVRFVADASDGWGTKRQVATLRTLRFPDVVEATAVLDAQTLDDPDVQLLIGLAHLYGEGVAHNRGLAAQWLERAAAGGNADARATIDRLRTPAQNLIDTITTKLRKKIGKPCLRP